MRIVFAGSGEFSVPTLRCLFEAHDVVLVITQPDRPAGRGRKTTPTPVRLIAEEFGIETLAVNDINQPGLCDRLELCGASLGVVAAFGQKIGPRALTALPYGWVNIHASLLPAYRGASPIQRAIADQCEWTGITVFKLVEKMDAGPIVITRRTRIGQEETRQELEDRLAGIACDAIKAAIPLFEHGPPDGESQDESQVSYAKRLFKHDGYVRFDMPADKVAAHVCSMWPWPGAACQFVSTSREKTEDVILARARQAEGAPVAGSPGEIDNRLYVTAADGQVEILEIKPRSGHLMTWRDFVNGRRVQAGDRFKAMPTKSP